MNGLVKGAFTWWGSPLCKKYNYGRTRDKWLVSKSFVGSINACYALDADYGLLCRAGHAPLVLGLSSMVSDVVDSVVQTQAILDHSNNPISVGVACDSNVTNESVIAMREYEFGLREHNGIVIERNVGTTRCRVVISSVRNDGEEGPFLNGGPYDDELKTSRILDMGPCDSYVFNTTVIPDILVKLIKARLTDTNKQATCREWIWRTHPRGKLSMDSVDNRAQVRAVTNAIFTEDIFGPGAIADFGSILQSYECKKLYNDELCCFAEDFGKSENEIMTRSRAVNVILGILGFGCSETSDKLWSNFLDVTGEPEVMDSVIHTGSNYVLSHYNDHSTNFDYFDYNGRCIKPPHSDRDKGLERYLPKKPRPEPITGIVLEDALKNVQIGPNLSKSQKEQIQLLVSKNWDVLNYSGRSPPMLEGVMHTMNSLYERIERSLCSIPQRVSAHQREHITTHLNELLNSGCIQPNSSAGLVLVKKEDGNWCIVQDFRQLNLRNRIVSCSTPLTTMYLKELRGNRFFSTLDIGSAFWQISLGSSCRRLAAFENYNQRQYQYSVPATHQEDANMVFNSQMWNQLLVRPTDVIIYNFTWDEHLMAIQTSLDLSRDNNLVFARSKTHFGFSEVESAGWIVTDKGYAPDSSKLQDIRDFGLDSSWDYNMVRKFLGVSHYFRMFVKDYASKTDTLRRLITRVPEIEGNDIVLSGNNRTTIVKSTMAMAKDCNLLNQWTRACNVAIAYVKNSVIPQILVYPDFSKMFELHVSASSVGIGATLAQRKGHVWNVISYTSQLFTRDQTKWKTLEQVCFAAVWSVNHFRFYLFNSKFLLVMDNSKLKWLVSIYEENGKLYRWVMRLSCHEFDIDAISTNQNAVPDGLSRYSIVTEDVETVTAVIATVYYIVHNESVNPHVSTVVEKLNNSSEETTRKFAEEVMSYFRCTDTILRERISQPNYCNTVIGSGMRNRPHGFILGFTQDMMGCWGITDDTIHNPSFTEAMCLFVKSRHGWSNIPMRVINGVTMFTTISTRRLAATSGIVISVDARDLVASGFNSKQASFKLFVYDFSVSDHNTALVLSRYGFSADRSGFVGDLVVRYTRVYGPDALGLHPRVVAAIECEEKDVLTLLRDRNVEFPPPELGNSATIDRKHGHYEPSFTVGSRPRTLISLDTAIPVGPKSSNRNETSKSKKFFSTQNQVVTGIKQECSDQGRGNIVQEIEDTYATDPWDGVAFLNEGIPRDMGDLGASGTEPNEIVDVFDSVSEVSFSAMFVPDVDDTLSASDVSNGSDMEVDFDDQFHSPTATLDVTPVYSVKKQYTDETEKICCFLVTRSQRIDMDWDAETVLGETHVEDTRTVSNVTGDGLLQAGHIEEIYNDPSDAEAFLVKVPYRAVLAAIMLGSEVSPMDSLCIIPGDAYLIWRNGYIVTNFDVVFRDFGEEVILSRNSRLVNAISSTVLFIYLLTVGI